MVVTPTLRVAKGRVEFICPVDVRRFMRLLTSYGSLCLIIR